MSDHTAYCPKSPHKNTLLHLRPAVFLIFLGAAVRDALCSSFGYQLGTPSKLPTCPSATAFCFRPGPSGFRRACRSETSMFSDSTSTSTSHSQSSLSPLPLLTYNGKSSSGTPHLTCAFGVHCCSSVKLRSIVCWASSSNSMYKKVHCKYAL